MRDLLQFDTMITPKIITLVYWLLLIGCAITGLVMLVTAFGMMKHSALAGLGMLVLAPIVTVLSAVLARIYCEIMIVLCKMNEALQVIRNR